MIRAAFAQIALLASPLLLFEVGRATATLFGLERCAPDFVSIAAAYAALEGGPTTACLWAATAGLFEDVPAGLPFGLGGARRATVVALLHAIRHEVDLSSPLVAPVAAFVVAFADKLLHSLLIAATTEGGAPLAPLVSQSALGALATAAMAPLVWPAIALVAAHATGQRERR